MSTGIMQANYGDLQKIATHFGHQAEKSKQLHRSLAYRMQQLQDDGWEGVGSSAFFAEMTQHVLPVLGRLEKAFEQAQQTTREIANLIRAAEEDAASVFKGHSPKVQAGKDKVSNNLDLLHRSTDLLVQEGLKLVLPTDRPNADEYITIRGEGGVKIPLAELGLPCSGYLDGSEEITIKRLSDGTYHLIISRENGIGLSESVEGSGWEFSAQAGLRAKDSYEFSFNPEIPGDLSKMAALATTIGGSDAISRLGVNVPFVAQAAMGLRQLAVESAKDHLMRTNVTLGNGVQLEGKLSFLKQELHGAHMVGFTMQRDSLNDPMTYVASHQISFGTEGAIELARLKENLGLAHNAEIALSVNQVYNSLSPTASQTQLVVTASSQGNLTDSAQAKSSPNGANLPGVEFEVNDAGSITRERTFVYTLNQPAESVIRTLQQGNFDPILANSSHEWSSTTTIEHNHDVKAKIGIPLVPSQELGIEAKGGYATGYEISHNGR